MLHPCLNRTRLGWQYATVVVLHITSCIVGCTAFVTCLKSWSLIWRVIDATWKLGLGIYGYLCTRVGYVIARRVPGYPHHLDLRRNRRFFCGKNKIETQFVETLTYLKARCTKTINLHTLIKIFLKFVLVCIIIWCKNLRMHRETYQNLQHFSVYIGIWVTC